MPASEETGSGPVVHDHRRIDPVTGQVRGKHAASKPAGTSGAGRPAGAPEAAGSSEPTGSHDDQDSAELTESPEEALEMVTALAVMGGKQAADFEAQLAERTADLQRLQAEYVNYRKRVDRDRAAVREQAVAGTLAGLLPGLDAIDPATVLRVGHTYEQEAGWIERRPPLATL